MRNLNALLLTAGLAVLAIVPARGQNLVDVASQAGKFGILLKAAKAADLVDTLKSPGPYTVFAPTDEAFAALGEGTLRDLLRPENKATLRKILLYHVLSREVLAARAKRLPTGTQVATVAGPNVRISNRDGLRINESRVVQADVLADNGVIHVIDRVLLPPDVRMAGQVSDRKDLVATAKDGGQFRTLLRAVEAAGLTEDLMGAGPFTVFAPTDRAFGKLGHKVDDLLRPENRDTLRRILAYHVVPKLVPATSVLEAPKRYRTLAGASLRFEFHGGLRVNEAKVTTNDVLAANGVIHVIDAVLTPPAHH